MFMKRIVRHWWIGSVVPALMALVFATGAGFVTPMTAFDPNFDYLDQGFCALSASNNKIRMYGETYATRRVDAIGVRLVLQRWTETGWIDVYYGTKKEEKNFDYVYQSHEDIPALKGHTYRVKSEHWIREGAVSESGVRYSPSITVP
jgi:hypothetical protein